MNLDFVCCFCNQSISHRNAVTIDAYPNPDRTEAQTFFAHIGCFSKALHPKVPNFLDLLED